mmetsp:Transcript_115788/g.248811  ORF Transcript_115788/g.248811 Transcript_115788/m.248811 type:complete len:330 (+) Transcript_115788:639-1628(+)
MQLLVSIEVLGFNVNGGIGIVDFRVSGSVGLVLSGKPWVLQHLIHVEAILGINLKTIPDEVFGVLADRLPVVALEIVTAVSDVVLEFLVRVAFEGRVAAEQNVHDDSTAPDVALLVVLPGEDLRSHVVRRASPALHGRVLLRVELLGEAEVDDLDGCGVLLHHHDVLRLQILVHEFLAVHERERPQRLLHDVADEGLVVARLLVAPEAVHAVLQLPALARLHDLHDRVRVDEVFVDLDHVRVIEHGHALDLLQDLLHLHAPFPLLPGDRLADALLPGHLVRDTVHLAEAALAQELPELVHARDGSLVLPDEAARLARERRREPGLLPAP